MIQLWLWKVQDFKKPFRRIGKEALLLSSGWQKAGKNRPFLVVFWRFRCSKEINEAVRNCPTPLLVVPCLSHLVLILFYMCFLWECLYLFSFGKEQYRKSRLWCEEASHAPHRSSCSNLSDCLYLSSIQAWLSAMKLEDDRSIFPWPHLCVWKAGSASPVKPPRQHCQREDEDVGSLVEGSKSTIKIKKANTQFW